MKVLSFVSRLVSEIEMCANGSLKAILYGYNTSVCVRAFGYWLLCIVPTFIPLCIDSFVQSRIFPILAYGFWPIYAIVSALLLFHISRLREVRLLFSDVQRKFLSASVDDLDELSGAQLRLVGQILGLSNSQVEDLMIVTPEGSERTNLFRRLKA